MNSSKDQQMDAVVIQASGPPAQSLAYRSEPAPAPGPGEVLVEVHAASVNPLDVVNVLGFLASPLPMIPGSDFAGVVVSDGEHLGQEVWGSGPALGLALDGVRPGTHARFVVIPETWLSRKPKSLTMAQAAAVGRSHWTAWQAVINVMEIKAGETILIIGGAGMVGQAATSLARWRGAEPIVAGRRRPDGVDLFIDTRSSDIPKAARALTDGRGVDMVLDTVGGEMFVPAIRSLRYDGRMVGLHGGSEPVTVDLNEIFNRQLHVTGLATVFYDGAHVARIFDQFRPLFDSGLLAPPAVKTWSLERAAEAYQTVMEGSGGIKQVLVPNGGGKRGATRL